MKKLIILSLFCVLITSCADLPAPWPNGRIPFNPIGLEQWETRCVIDAMAEWEIASGGLIKFEITDRVGDGVLHIGRMLNYYTEGWGSVGYNPSQPAIILIDILFKQEIIIHELGHVIGLYDSFYNPYSVMYYTDSGKQRSIGIQEINEVISLYSTK